jgi:hypothetical protein
MASRWHEWLIAVCVTALSLFAVWTVFGDELVLLFQPPPQPASTASPRS